MQETLMVVLVFALNLANLRCLFHWVHIWFS